MADLGPGTGQRDRLVGALAAQHPFMVEGRHRLARCREMRHAVDEVDIDGTKVENRHVRRQMGEIRSGKLHLLRD